ncbi:ribulose 1,5-bisphosphate carboxylase large subunit [Rhodococcus fascians]|nr:ribulose 1,5-bisphosphate carboxylase large subunit [Rhodococcus fascians]MBY3999385.1 ribulose 1,5-bisphosphate carboxylase large subunit [Rhodococcus fascians]MBY4001334.1 ribulose 1,5-bisphosphate carboxylase large subunit [Rhodococcus fascians]MBY4010054.1 ribulose 1,5-bisphosphate carboxylase large subunit [Rhodococcus fascians]MBY4015244.1 ribulose 1,5-bisphosphate carboxylase large subunit [Rhodococcus fascians]
MALVLAGVVLPDPLGTETVLRRGAAVARAGVSWMFTTADFALTLPGRIEALLSRIETLMTRIDHVIDSADAVVAHVQRTTGAADTVVASASAASHTALELIGMFDPIAKKTEPMARRFVDNLSDAEVDAAIAMVDQLPGLLDHMEALLPILATLDTVSPEIHELLGVTKDVRRAVIGIPGFKFFRNRGEDKLNDEMEDEQR